MAGYTGYKSLTYHSNLNNIFIILVLKPYLPYVILDIIHIRHV